MDDKTARNAAFEMVRQYGFVDAKARAEQLRDMNSPGTASFCYHNQICKWMHNFATAGTMFRTV